MEKVSALIISKNEAHVIERCVRSLAWADEILVIDAESTDGTPELARKAGARVITRPWSGFREQRML
jgi:glycosyltransferase involved in cell wall biosynthesis